MHRALTYRKQRLYFESGCLCIKTGRIAKSVGTDVEAFEYYMANCKCSRHPNSQGEAPWEKAARQEQ